MASRKTRTSGSGRLHQFVRRPTVQTAAQIAAIRVAEAKATKKAALDSIAKAADAKEKANTEERLTNAVNWIKKKIEKASAQQAPDTKNLQKEAATRFNVQLRSLQRRWATTRDHDTDYIPGKPGPKFMLTEYEELKLAAYVEYQRAKAHSVKVSELRTFVATVLSWRGMSKTPSKSWASEFIKRSNLNLIMRKARTKEQCRVGLTEATSAARLSSFSCFFISALSVFSLFSLSCASFLLRASPQLMTSSLSPSLEPRCPCFLRAAGLGLMCS